MLDAFGVKHARSTADARFRSEPGSIPDINHRPLSCLGVALLALTLHREAVSQQSPGSRSAPGCTNPGFPRTRMGCNDASSIPGCNTRRLTTRQNANCATPSGSIDQHVTFLSCATRPKAVMLNAFGVNDTILTSIGDLRKGECETRSGHDVSF